MGLILSFGEVGAITTCPLDIVTDSLKAQETLSGDPGGGKGDAGNKLDEASIP